MANNAQNVSVGKPKVAGAIHVAPVGTSLPTDATTALGAGFNQLGYVSDAGLTNSTNLEVSKIKAWGGDTVLITQTSKEDTFKFVLLETLKKEVAQFIYGASNVTGDINTGLTIKANNGEVEEVSIVIDMILRGDVAKRIVIPDCKVSAVGDIVYKDDEAIGYDTTVDCIQDASGNAHYEYMIDQSPST